MATNEVTVAIASQPQRKQGLLNAVAELLPQCDRLCICLNGYDEVPPELPKSKKIITVLANAKTGIRDLGCNNKMYWAGDFDGYYATVDDDIDYPPNYIASLKAKVDKYGRKAICSYHGHVYNGITNGRISFLNRTVHLFQLDYDTDLPCHRVGMGVAMCCPKEIGLRKSLYLARPKNFGDDEITAVWAQENNVPLVRVANDGVKLLENLRFSRNGGLCTDNRSMQSRARYLESYVGWKLNVPYAVGDDSPFFRIIIPTFNSEAFLERCIDSIMSQTFKHFKVVLVDDASTDGTAELLKKIAANWPTKVEYELLDKKAYGGGARNVALRHVPGAAYTLFLDSDDYYVSDTALEHLHKLIIASGSPDLVKCARYDVRDGVRRLAKFDGHALKDVVRLCQPATSCVKTELCPQFIPDRIRFNDVIWSLRTYDKCKSLAVMDEPLFVYTIGDNPNSCQHAAIDTARQAAVYYLIADLMHESYETPCVEAQRLAIIESKVELLKQNNFYL